MNLKVIFMCLFAFFFVFLLALSSSASAAVIYVKPTGLDANDGKSWSAAKKTIQAGLNTAVSGDEVWVAGGTYGQRLTLKISVGLYGGFSGTETQRGQRNTTTNITTIDGAKGGSVVTVPVGAAASTVIDGFTIKNGTGTAQGEVRYGGGIYALDASPTISNNILIDNSAANGAGIYCNKSITVKSNIFKQNNATLYGGGAMLQFGPVTIEGNTFDSNRATNGGGLSVPHVSSGSISRNTFHANYATSGGGIHCMGPHPIISANTFTDNSGYFGTALAYNGGAGTTLANWMSGNKALINGGAIFCYSNCAENIINNVIINGSAGFGGGIATKESNPKIFNNTFVGNTATSGGGGIAFVESGGGTARNNIIVSGSSGIYADPGLTPTLSHNNIFGNTSSDYAGVSPGAGSLHLDPAFKNQAANDFHLNSSSPCVDTGTNTDAPAVDYDGTTRPQDGDGSGTATTDIGAFESPGVNSVKPAAPKNLRIIGN